MARMNDEAHERVYVLKELRYYAALGGLALMAPLSLTTLLWLLPPAHAVDNWQVDGANGVLEVRGALTESACRLEMDSARQDIWLGDVATGRLAKVGDRGAAVVLELRLRDCLRGPADVDNPQLVKAQGVSGLGLRFLDAGGEDVRLGSRGKPLWLTPGSDTLTYQVAPERTAAPLMAGSYRAVVDSSLSYD